MDGKILICEKGEWDMICFFKYLHFKGRISCTDTDDFDFVFKVWIIIYHLIHFVYPGRILLTVRAVHAKNFNDHHFGLDLWYLESARAWKPQVGFLIRIFRYWKVDHRQYITF